MRGSVPSPCPHAFGTYTVTQDGESFECCKDCHNIVSIDGKWFNIETEEVTLIARAIKNDDKYLSVFEEFLGENSE